jgi:hypothetical protein
MPTSPQRFVGLWDLHYGFERRGGHKVALHDERALACALAFINDFKPHTIICGGDMLDCAVISHHTKGKPGQREGLRLLADAQGLKDALIAPLERTKAKLIYLKGNHEGWLDQLVEVEPGLEGILDLPRLLNLAPARWTVVEQGSLYRLGKLVFAHGDQFSGGEHVAKAAVTACEKSVRLGHFHSFQTYTKNSLVTAQAHTGVVVPCLCRKGPGYGKGAPNRWTQGFLYGYLNTDGSYNDYVTIINDGKATIGGRVYGA